MKLPPQISKVFLIFLTLIITFYIYMDVNLFLRVKYYSIEQYKENLTKYEDVVWVPCDINPLCYVTVKGLLLDATNFYIFSPLASLLNEIFRISETAITPNQISIFHVFVAMLSGKLISSDLLNVRRVGVVLFQVRTFLDSLDGHIARVRMKVQGERSDTGSTGYYVDGICDAFGCVFLLVGVWVYLKNNSPKKGYLPVNIPGEKGLTYKSKVVTKKLCCFSAQLMLSSTAWNRYIVLYQDILERSPVTDSRLARQEAVFKSSMWLFVAYLWRLVNVHNLLHCLLLSIFCDWLWQLLCLVQYVGFLVLLFVVGLTEMHLLEARAYVFDRLTGDGS